MLSGLKILYIEDDEGLMYLLKDALEAENCEVVYAKDGPDGLELIQNTTFDAVIVDQNMPQMSGLEVIKRVQFIKNPPPMVMVTGAGNEEIAVEAMRLGSSDYIVKDTDMTYLKILPSVLRQVVQQNRLAQEHEIAKQALVEEKIRSNFLAQFINDASHEFRTPLTVIRTSADLLAYMCKEPKQQKHLQKITDHVDNILQLVEDLMLIAKHDNSSKLELQKTISLNNLLLDVLQTKAECFSSKSICLENDIPQETIMIEADAEYLQHAFEELLNNACSFSDSGTKVTVSVSKSESNAIIKFTDTGIGISEENLSRIFERFYRVNTANIAGGFGLGLAIVSRIINLHGGEISVQSMLDKGSVFTITLPLKTCQS